MSIFLITLLGLASIACKKSDPMPEGQITIDFEDSQDLPETAIVATFKKVVADSRCPTTVECIWAGEVSVEIEFLIDGQTEVKTLTLEEVRTEKPSITINGVKIVLENVLPYPEDPDGIDDKDYSILLCVN